MKGWVLPLLLGLGAATQVLVASLLWYDFSVTLNGGPAEALGGLLLACWPLILAGVGAGAAVRLRGRHPGWALAAAWAPIVLLGLVLLGAGLLWLFPPALHSR